MIVAEALWIILGLVIACALGYVLGVGSGYRTSEHDRKQQQDSQQEK